MRGKFRRKRGERTVSGGKLRNEIHSSYSSPYFGVLEWW